MKRTFRNSALAIIALAATLFTVPAQAQSWGQRDGGERGRGPQGQASWNRNGEDRGGRDHRYDRRFDDRRFDDRRDFGRGYERPEYRGNDWRGYGYREGYVVNEPYVAPAPPPPAYGYYAEPGYSYGPTRNGRSAAIIGGSAVAGALIGGAAGHGQGAVIGAVVGGVAGVIADQAVRQHDYHR